MARDGALLASYVTGGPARMPPSTADSVNLFAQVCRRSRRSSASTTSSSSSAIMTGCPCAFLRPPRAPTCGDSHTTTASWKYVLDGAPLPLESYSARRRGGIGRRRGRASGIAARSVRTGGSVNRGSAESQGGTKSLCVRSRCRKGDTRLTMPAAPENASNGWSEGPLPRSSSSAPLSQDREHSPPLVSPTTSSACLNGRPDQSRSTSARGRLGTVGKVGVRKRGTGRRGEPLAIDLGGLAGGRSGRGGDRSRSVREVQKEYDDRRRRRQEPHDRQVKDDDAVSRIKKLSKRRRWRDALELLAAIPSPSEDEFIAAITACDRSGEPKQALRVHALMVGAGFRPTVESVYPVVRGLVLSGDATTALRIFKQSGMRPQCHNSSTSGERARKAKMTMSRLYALLVRAAQKTGDWRQAVLLYREAELLQPAPSPGTAAVVFLTCYAQKQYAAAVSFAADALRPPWDDVGRRRILMNKVIVACGRAGPDHYRLAVDTFHDLEETIGADGYTLTAMIDVFRRLGDWQRASVLLDRAAAFGVSANRGLRSSLNAVINAMGPDHYREARDLAERAAKEWGVHGDVVTYGTLLLAASEQLPPAEPLAVDGEGRGDQATVLSVSADATAGAGVSDGLRRDTVQLLRLAADANAVPSESCLNMVMFRLARGGLWEDAEAFVEEIAKTGRRVSRNQREALVEALASGERWVEVVREVETMLREAITVDNATAGLAMKAYANIGLREHWDSAVALLKSARKATEKMAANDKIDASSWRCLLSGLSRDGLDEEAAVVMREMASEGIAMDEHSGSALIVAAHAAGRYEAALAWMRKLRRADLPVSRNGYAAAVSACCLLEDPTAAIGMLESMAGAHVVPHTALYDAVLEMICSGGMRDHGDSVPNVAEVENSVGGFPQKETEFSDGDDVGTSASSNEAVGKRSRYWTAAERAHSAVSLMADMRRRDVPLSASTFALVASALIDADRTGEVLDLWRRALTDVGASSLRRDVAHRVLSLCRARGLGTLAVQLLRVGVVLVDGKEEWWPRAGNIWAAMQACKAEGASAWSSSLALLDVWDARGLPQDERLVEAAAKLVEEAAAQGFVDAIEAFATGCWLRRKATPDLGTEQLASAPLAEVAGAAESATNAIDHQA